MAEQAWWKTAIEGATKEPAVFAFVATLVAVSAGPSVGFPVWVAATIPSLLYVVFTLSRYFDSVRAERKIEMEVRKIEAEKGKPARDRLQCPVQDGNEGNDKSG